VRVGGVQEVSALTAKLDAEVAEWRSRPLTEEYPYLIFDARYERVRRGGSVVSQDVLMETNQEWMGRIYLSMEEASAIEEEYPADVTEAPAVAARGADSLRATPSASRHLNQQQEPTTLTARGEVTRPRKQLLFENRDP